VGAGHKKSSENAPQLAGEDALPPGNRPRGHAKQQRRTGKHMASNGAGKHVKRSKNRSGLLFIAERIRIRFIPRFSRV
jgi:hypothetical protein